uniref:NADH-ubiquinone oxidoreductase chain 5 n=1 Tax=Coleoptera sp. ACP-2013 TaxID=2485033 RepID=A0A3G3MEF7_9COLE|nr:NADH dehydrogenase subunit 5 [Coleoptera sp. ACP-2013]
MCLLYYILFLILSILFFGGFLCFMMWDMIVFLELEFLNINSSLIVMTVLLDWMSFLFMSFVLFISSMVIYYSSEYMLGDKFMNRFILLVVMFVASMMMLIISPNLVSILLGWDGLGLVSYCLVVYYQNEKSFNAGMLTVMMNRLGDVAILMSIAWMLNFGSWNYVFCLDFSKDLSWMSWVVLMVVLAAMTKSAQIPFSSWLPAAMAAPTPVSSLVHSSTLVTAGVYLLIRFNFSFSGFIMFFFLFVSLMTMFMSGLGASFEFDLKKIIALSTLSQLGLMMSVLFLGDYLLAFFHLLIHALFKALLFMCAGSMIHGLMNCQDIRFMGVTVQLMPLTCSYFNISNMSLCGLPFLSGFYSKDLVLEFMCMNYLNFYIYMIFYLSIGLTAAYSFRLLYYSFVGEFNFCSLSFMGDKSGPMISGMTGLIFFVIFMGSILSWLLFSSPYVIILTLTMKNMVLFFVVLGMFFGFLVSSISLNYKSASLRSYYWSFFLSSMWCLPYLSTFGVNYYFLLMGGKTLKILDQGWSEFYGSQKINYEFISCSKFLQFLFSNSLKIYFIMLLFWVMILFFV